MEFRRTRIEDIKKVMRIINQAQAYFKNEGIDQWQNNYPNEDTILKDIDDGYSYVLLKEGNIIATFALSFDGEITYERIYDGQWLSDGSYGVLHRIAVDENYKGQGVSSVIIKKVEEISLEKGIHSLRIDTHIDNLSMQKMIGKNDFKYCGVIFLEDGSKRVAYEKKVQGKEVKR